MPIQLQAILKAWEDELRYLVENGISADLATPILWQKYDKPQSEFQPNRNFRDVSPLISSTWGQEGNYNDLCPANTPVGCVATAMAQIMRYWSFPAVGQGSHSYNHPVYGTQSADFGSTTYNWAGMPNQVNNPNISVATICYHAGVSVNMDYSPTGSGAYSWVVDDALRNYFKYSGSTTYYEKQDFSDTNWKAMLRGEFDNGRPVYYSGYGNDGGHAFILDGYQGTEYFHVNWGWNGYYNGYYYLNDLNAGGSNFSNGQAAVMGITPTQSQPSLVEGFEATTFPPDGWGRSATTWARYTTGPIAGTASARYYGSANNVRLTTPLLSLTTETTLTFRAKRGTVNRSEVLNIQTSTNGSTWTTFYTTPVLTTSAITFNVPFNTLTPGDYYIAFNANSSNNNSQTKTIYLDDVSGPALANVPAQAAINISSWNAGNVAPGASNSSGNVFQLSNVGGGLLEITGITNLSGSDFSCSINQSAQLVYGQVHEFSFTYEPLNYGTDSQNFQIVTNGGTISISLSGEASAFLFGDGFETYADFTLDISPWTQYDGDGSNTYSIEDCTFPNQGYTGSFMVFNSSQTSPSLAGTPADAYSGAKGAYCFAAVTFPNNDWLISPQFTLVGPTCKVSFWAKSYTDAYGLERFKVLYSTTTNAVGSFTNYLAGSASAYVSAPVDWFYYEYTLPTTAKYVAIQCISSDAFIFMVDSFLITDSGQTPPTPLFGNLNGYVYEYGTTNPIANAVVNVGAKSATTNSSGFYQINNLIVGTYGGTCNAPGTDYFSDSVTGINITEGGTASQNFYLKWSELAVNATAFTSTLYLGQNEDQTLTISNPGGTADLLYDWFYLPYTATSTSPRQTDNPARAKAVDKTRAVPELSGSKPKVAVSGWLEYGIIDDAAYYTPYVPERATKFTLSDWGLWSDSGVTVNQLEAYFYEPSTDLWGTEDTFVFKIYAADGSTVLHISPAITALPQTTTWNPTTYTLSPPLTIDGDFYVAVVPEGTASGKPYGLSTAYSYGYSYYGLAGSWTALADEEHIMAAQIDGNYWVYASGGTGTVAPGASENVNLNFDTTDLSVGTYHGLLSIVNNSNYIAPSPRGDNLVITLTLDVAQGYFGTVEGHVYLAGSSTVVPLAEITIPGYDPIYTDADGWYSISNVEISSNAIGATAFGCQPYSGSITILENQTTTHDIYLDYSQFSTPQTNFVMDCYANQSTSTSTPISNTGTWAVDWSTGSGIWGGVTYNSGPLIEDFEDLDISGWSGFVGPNSDIYTGYGYNSTHTWVFASEGSSEPQYIITPMLQPDASSMLSFWYQQFNDSDEVLKIMVSRTDTAISSFTDFMTINMTTANHQVWTQFSASLADYADEDHIYVCFYYPRVDGYQYGYVMIDDIIGPDVMLPYSQWLSSSPQGTLPAGGSDTLNLYADATGLPVGIYTAQTWVFGTAVNEPYKLYVTLNVTEAPQDVDPPQNLIIAAQNTYVELAWDEVDHAQSYHVWCANDPYPLDETNYTIEVLHVADTFAEITYAALAALGFDPARAFFRVTADSATLRQRATYAPSKTHNASQALDILYGPTHKRTLKLSE